MFFDRYLKNVPVLALYLIIFIAAIDISLVATLLPHIIASLGDMELYPLMSASFMASFFIATPLFGIGVDHMGSKKAAFLAMSFFLIGSIFCGLSFSMSALIFARLIQGVGAGGLVNVCFITIGKHYKTDSKRSLMQAQLSSIWAFASIVAPLIGATISELISWRFAFFINVPIGLIALLFMSQFQETAPQLDEKFDRKSIFLFVGASILTFLSLFLYKQRGIDLSNCLIFTSAILLGFIFIWRELSSRNPLIPFNLLRKCLDCLTNGLFILERLFFIPEEVLKIVANPTRFSSYLLLL